MPEPILPTARVRLRGVVDGEGVVLRRVSLAVGDSVQVAANGGSFVVVTDEGARVAVDLAEDGEVVPPKITSAPWSEVERDEAARLFRSSAPAPYVKVHMMDRVVRGGDTIEIEAEVLETHALDSDAYRTTAGMVPSHVRAHVVGVGQDRTRHLERVLAKRTRSARGRSFGARLFGAIEVAWSFFLAHMRLLLAIPAVLLIGWAIPRSVGSFSSPTAALYVFAIGLGCLGLLATWEWWAREIPRVDDGERPNHPGRVWGGVIFFPPVVALLPALVVLWMLYAAIVITVRTSQSSRLIRMALATPPHPQDLTDEPWGALEGKIVEHEPTMRVVSTRGPVDVDARDALWSSIGAEERSIDARGSVLVVGRLRRTNEHDGRDELRMSAGGPESLVFFTGPEGTDLRGELRALTLRRNLVRGFLLASAVIEVVHALGTLNL